MPVLDRAKTGGSARSPQPAPPIRQFSFTDFQVNNPSSPLPADRIDGEIDRTNHALSDTLDWVSVSLNSDGSIKPQAIGKAQFQPGLFDQIAAPALDEVQSLVNSARAASREAIAAGQEADASSLAAATQNAQAFDAAQLSSSEAQDAAASAADAAESALEAQASATASLNSANHADLAEAVCIDYGVLTQAWAEHMPDTIPPNILAVMDVTGDHWSSRWWANRAAQIAAGVGDMTASIGDIAPVPPQPGQLWWDSVGGQLYVWYVDPTGPGQWVAATNLPAIPGPAGAQGIQGPQGPTGAPGSGTVSGMAGGQIPIASTATAITSSANLSGDVTSNATLVTTLATVNPNVGTFQGLTLDGKGRVTAAANQSYATAAAMATADNLRVLKAGDTMSGTLVTGNLAPTSPQNGSVVATHLAASLPQIGINATFSGSGWNYLAGTARCAYAISGDPSAGNLGFFAAPAGNAGAVAPMTGIFNINSAGDAQINRNLYVGFAQGATNPVLTASAPNWYTELFAPDATGSGTGIHIGSVGSGATTYYRNSIQSFQNSAAAATYASFQAGGTYNVSGSWLTISDASVKSDVQPYQRGLAEILELRPVTFRYNERSPFGDTAPIRYGLIAQEVQPIVPEATGTYTHKTEKDEVDLMTVEPGHMTYLLINAVKELRAQIVDLQAEIAAFKASAGA